MKDPGYPRRKVVRITKAPLNNRLWSLDLSCGHDVWIESKRRPRRTRQACPHCHLWRPAPVDAYP